MPFPFGPIGGLIGGALNIASTGQQNRKSQQFARERYRVERNDALDFWRQQNEYNSPQAQMQRLTDAGLNKNLVFGLGSSGNAGQIDTPDTQQAQFRTPNFGEIPAQIGAYADTEIKQAQLNNLEMQNSVLFQDWLLKQSEVSGKNIANKIGITQHARDRLKLIAEGFITRYSADFAKQEQRQRLQGIQKTKVEVKRIEQQIKNLKGSHHLEMIKIQLRDMGIQEHDPIYARMLIMMLNKIK